MRSYKLVNNLDIQEKAKRLGFIAEFSLNLESPTIFDPFMYIEDGCYYLGDDIDQYRECSFKEITQEDFLALPEPIKKGDWVKYKGFAKGSKPIFGCIKELHTNNRYIVMHEMEESMSVDKITKLTSEQIKVLELE